MEEERLETKLLTSIKLYPNMKNIDDNLIKDIITDVINELRGYLNYEDTEELPGCIHSIIKKETMRRINRIGFEGIASNSFSGVSSSFIDGFPKDEKKVLHNLRRMPSVNSE